MLPLLILALGLAPAQAADTWTDPLPGVRHLRRTASGPIVLNALVIDLCAKGVSLRATDEDEKRRTVSSFAGLVGAEAAINADFFSYSTYDPVGMAVGDGHLWHGDTTTSASILFGRDHALINEAATVLDASSLPGWVHEGVSGYPILVEEGVALTSFSRSDCTDRHPRSFVGLSRDQRSLILAVVDGRSSASRGMTCAELATTMVGLGAWRAMNVDGGGSSALWLSGEGVLNDPSDGSERVVSNHLGVHATGSGAPESCDFSLDEPVLDAAALEGAAHTDVDGDGLADLCGRDGTGWRCWPSTGAGFGSSLDLGSLADASGWSAERFFSTIRTGDLDGDGKGDVCARGASRTYCWRSTGSGWSASETLEAMGDSEGWGDPDYANSIRMLDIDGDGGDDLCGRGPDGVLCWPYEEGGFGAPIAGPTLSDASGWRQPEHYGTLRSGDVNGDGIDDLCARGGAGMLCWLGDGSGYRERIDGPEWSDAAGFADVAYWSTIRLADLDGDGKDDLCARGPDGFVCHRSTGWAFGGEIAGPTLSDASGWDDHSNYATIRMADVDADGDLDVCARANARFCCWLNADGAFAERIDGPELSDATGWDDHRYYSTLRMADLDGDGRADLCARAGAGIRCWRSTGLGFEASIVGPELSDAAGWSDEARFSTLRWADPPPPPEAPDDTGQDSGGIPDPDSGGLATDGTGGGEAGDDDWGEEPAGRRVEADPGCGCGGGGSTSAGLVLLGAASALRRRRSARPR